jgi:Bacterial conjugation TrbI-like protein
MCAMRNQARDRISIGTPEIALGLSTGTRLRARLESAASTAVRAPVLAVVEYTYERDGQIVVPAGAKAVGRIQEADRSGYVRLQFESLLMPDGATVPIQAVAIDLDTRPLKGKVEGKNTGKNVLVRSLSGIGQAGALLLGRGSLNQPLSESDVMRERVSNNVGEASDEEISRTAITSRIVVTVSADTPIYVVLEQTPKEGGALGQSDGRSWQSLTTNAEELRQLLQLKRELNQVSGTPQ